MRNLFKIIFGVSLGAVYGLLFAQRSGKELRKNLKVSKSPIKTIINEGVEIDKEARKTLSDWASNSEEVKQLLVKAQEYFDAIKDQAGDMSESAKKEMQKTLKSISKEADATVKQLGTKSKKVMKTASKKVSLTTKKATKKATKKVKTAVSMVKKKLK